MLGGSMKKKKLIFLLIVAVLIITAGVLAYWLYIGGVSEEGTKQQSTQSEASKPASDKDIAGLIESTGSLSTLKDVLTASAVAETLKATGPYTVVAPNNAAFSALSSGTVERFLKPENAKQLSSIANYFVISGQVLTDQLTNGQRLKTLNGQEVIVELADGNVYFVDAKGNKALVIKSDMKAKNGVIHVVDTVILPQ